MARDTGIADRIRAMGVRVIETAGWQTRGNAAFSPRGAVNHHTAGSSRGNVPSLNVAINGTGSTAPGPLYNVLQSREPDGNDVAYVLAAGRANHAGSGGWQGLSGNSSVYGHALEHTGVEPLPRGRQEIAARIVAALIQGRAAAGMCCQHFEWTSRKIDAAQGVHPNEFRAWIAATLGGGRPGPPAPEPEPVPTLTETNMCIIFGPSGAALAGAGYWQTLDSEGFDRWRSVPGMAVQQVDQRGWDVMRASALYGLAANPREDQD